MGTAEALGGLRQNIQGRAIGIGEDIRVPQADDPPALAFEIAGSASVRLYGVEMLAAVKLDAQPCAAASEIDDKGRDDQLPGKGRAVAGDAVPDGEFSRCWVVAQLASARVSSGSMRRSMWWLLEAALRANPPLAPPFQGGEWRPVCDTGIAV